MTAMFFPALGACEMDNHVVGFGPDRYVRGADAGTTAGRTA